MTKEASELGLLGELNRHGLVVHWDGSEGVVGDVLDHVLQAETDAPQGNVLVVLVFVASQSLEHV